MALEYYIRSGQKLLRCGCTTGTCAALAASGAARLLLTGRIPEKLVLTVPMGLTVEAAPLDWALEEGRARCAVEKDGGDDADATDGCRIVAVVSYGETGIVISGGTGVGRVTKPGLDQPVGAAAINRVPRRMIEEAVRKECEAAGYHGGLEIEISVPEGEAIARRTFNPVLGIEGGISILGTSGIVEPMSERAIVDTIAVALRQAAVSGKRLILTPGSYGQDFLPSLGLDLRELPCVKYSNFLGETLDTAAAEGFSTVLIVGHIGKLVKAAGGIMNTHSRWADCRMELFCAHTAVCGGDRTLCRRLMDAVSADACIALLDQAGLREAVLDSLLEAIQRHLDRRAAGAFTAGAVLFSNRYGLLGRTAAADTILGQWKNVK